MISLPWQIQSYSRLNSPFGTLFFFFISFGNGNAILLNFSCLPDLFCNLIIFFGGYVVFCVCLVFVEKKEEKLDSICGT